MKVLFLDSGNDTMNEMFRIERNKVKECTSQCLYKNNKNRGLITKFIQFIGIYIFNPVLYFIYGDWKKKLNGYDAFIIPSRKSSVYAAKYIKNKTSKRVIIWYWNTVGPNELNPVECQKKGYETWSFDKEDCKKYNMKFGDTYYFNFNDVSKKEEKYSLFYVGLNQPGRKEFLNKLSTFLKKNKLRYKFNLCAMPNEVTTNSSEFSKPLDYDKVIEYISESNAILDLNKKNQSGLTLRPLEAFYFRKKLVTNNADIVNYKIYNEDTIFVINENNFDELISFLKKENVKYSKEVYDYYLFENWLNRILNNKEAE